MSAILLKLILLPFSLVVFLVSPNVYTSIIFPILRLSIVSHLFVYLSWVFLPSCDISLFLQWVYMLCLSIFMELSEVTPICRSPILHLRQRMSSTISLEISKRSIVKFSMHEHTYSSEWVVTVTIICVSNYSNAMWESFIESTDIKRHKDLIHLFYRSVFIILLNGVDYSVFVIFFELIILLL